MVVKLRLEPWNLSFHLVDREPKSRHIEVSIKSGYISNTNHKI